MSVSALWRVDITYGTRENTRLRGEVIEQRVYVLARFAMSFVPGQLAITQWMQGSRYGPDYGGAFDWPVGSTLEMVYMQRFTNQIHKRGILSDLDWVSVESLMRTFFGCEIHGGFGGRLSE